MGRPSDYNIETATEICRRLSDGESLRQITRDPAMPGGTTVFRWLEAHEAFRVQYARAREALLEHWAAEIVDIADDGSNDWYERETRNGNTITDVNREHISRSQLRIDTRKWLMSKLSPRKYGDKVALTGSDGEGPVKISVTPSDAGL